MLSTFGFKVDQLNSDNECTAFRYNDIAKHGYDAMGRSKSSVEESSSQTKSSEKTNASNTKRLSGLGG